MSLTNPLLRELKGYVQKLITYQRPIRDNEIVSFCECLERILYNGLYPQRNAIGLIKSQDESCWNWLEKTADEKMGAPYSFVSALNSVKNCKKITTYRGRTRLLIRNMLVKRCLHVPVQVLANENRSVLNYHVNSVLGDEILSQILLSVLMLCSKMQFKLDLNNSRFLDETWMLPECQSLQLVPCTQLGLSVTFVDGMAVVISVLPFSVADDNANIKIGDILDELNGFCITESLQGSLMNVIRKFSGQPIDVYIIKAVASGFGGELFGPLCPVLKKAGLDPEVVYSQYSTQPSPVVDPSNTQTLDLETAQPVIEAFITYLGSIIVGEQRNDLKIMDSTIEQFVKIQCSSNNNPPRIVFEFHNLGLSVIKEGSEEVLLKHYFMEITSCSIHKSNFLAYIAGESILDIKQYKCYIFQCSSYENDEDLNKPILQFEIREEMAFCQMQVRNK